MKITPELFEAHLKCPTKCWLRATVEPASGNDYADWVRSRNESYRSEAVNRLITGLPTREHAVNPPANTLKTARWQLALGVTVASQLRSSRGHEAQTSFSPPATPGAKGLDQSLLTSAATKLESRLHAADPGGCATNARNITTRSRRWRFGKRKSTSSATTEETL